MKRARPSMLASIAAASVLGCAGATGPQLVSPRSASPSPVVATPAAVAVIPATTVNLWIPPKPTDAAKPVVPAEGVCVSAEEAAQTTNAWAAWRIAQAEQALRKRGLQRLNAGVAPMLPPNVLSAGYRDSGCGELEPGSSQDLGECYVSQIAETHLVWLWPAVWRRSDRRRAGICLCSTWRNDGANSDG